MDPVALATATTAVTTLALEVLKGTASQAGKDVWSRIKTLLRWKSDPSEAKLAPTIARGLSADVDVTKQILELLQKQPTGQASTLVGSIDANNVIVADTINVAGYLKM